MEITEVKVFPVDEEKLKAYITIVLDNCFVVRDLKIIGGTAGLFVAMPSKRRKDGSFKDIAHPLNQGTRATMEKIILDAYLDDIRRGGATSQTSEEAERADQSSEPGRSEQG
jgi:stage V sporulation protein G